LAIIARTYVLVRRPGFDRFYRKRIDRTATATTMMMELESQVVVVETTTTTTSAASAAHVRTTVALRLLAFAASLAAAVVIATNRQDRWGITVTFKMFAVWEYVYIYIAGIC
jgi:predicted nucleic acid-binding protein